MYRIGAFSRLCETPIKTLRYYHDIGLLRPAHVDRESRYRLYGSEQVERVHRILFYRGLGFSLEEIGNLLAESPGSIRTRRMLERKRREIASRLHAERRRLARISAQLDLLEDSASDAPPVVLKRAGARLIVSMRARLDSHQECDRLFEELEGRVRAKTNRRERGALWHECGPEGIDCEAFLFLTGPIPADGGTSVHEMPAQRVASLVYRDDADYLEAYRNARAWMRAMDLEVSGPKREIYLQGEGSNAASHIEIQFPVSADSSDSREPGPWR
jgi:DNA-binding transcriptional MerR regulator